VPYTHNGDLGGLQAEVAAELMHVTQQVVRALQAAYRPDALNAGMNLGKVAGAGVPDHLHMHVVPRWSGDTNFMPVLAQTKVLPETLDQTYDRLAPYFAAEPRHAGLDL
jgi:ATP adenylyltransferase